jgi:hypothetical protein
MLFAKNIWVTLFVCHKRLQCIIIHAISISKMFLYLGASVIVVRKAAVHH